MNRKGTCILVNDTDSKIISNSGGTIHLEDHSKGEINKNNKWRIANEGKGYWTIKTDHDKKFLCCEAETDRIILKEPPAGDERLKWTEHQWQIKAIDNSNVRFRIFLNDQDKGKLLAIDMNDTGAQLIIKKLGDSGSVWTSFKVPDEPAKSNTEVNEGYS